MTGATEALETKDRDPGRVTRKARERLKTRFVRALEGWTLRVKNNLSKLRAFCSTTKGPGNGKLPGNSSSAPAEQEKYFFGSF